MKYDFETIMDRKGKDAVAIEKIPIPGAEIKPGFSRIPMWVADMNFATVPSVVEAIISRASHPAYGYFNLPKEYYQSIINWHKRHGEVEIDTDCIGYENGVLGGVLSALQVFCSSGDHVLIHSPTYIGFTRSLENYGYRIVHSPLYMDDSGVWRMNFEDMEQKIKEKNIHATVFCSPHNPCGRVWERWEIESAMDIFKRNNVYVISDEIWADLTLEGYKHIPTQSVNEDAKQRTVALYAPSKTFNLAGLVGSYHIVYNSWIRDRLKKTSNISHYNEPNVLSIHALMGAYSSQGDEWLEQLRSVLTQNVTYGFEFLNKHFPEIKLSKPQATYMLYLDLTQWCQKHQVSIDEILKRGVEVGVIWQDGRPFCQPNSIRMNLAVPYSQVKEAFDRLKQYVFI